MKYKNKHLIYKQINNSSCIFIDINIILKLNIHCYVDMIEYLDYIINKDYKINDFKKQYLLAQKKCKNKITFKKIYNNINLNNKIKQRCKKKEIETFLNLVNYNNEYIYIYNYCVQQNKNIYIINSGYFENNIVKGVLKNFDLKGNYKIINYDTINNNDLNNSCFILNSNLYSNRFNNYLVLKNTNVISDRDYKKLVLKNKMNKVEKINFSIITGFINNNSGTFNNYFEKLGFTKFGILLYAYVLFLSKNIDCNSNKICFLARDGHIIKKAYELLETSNVNTCYLYVSRKSLLKSVKFNKTKKCFIKYLDSLDVSGNISVVDIGWHGSLQQALKIIVPNLNVKGYYLGILNKKNQDTYSFLSDLNSLQHYAGALELMFSAPHGTTIDYGNSGYVLKDCEFSEEELKKIFFIQNSALSFIKEFDSFYSKMDLELSYKESFAIIKDFLINPSISDIKKFGSITFQDKNEKQLVPIENFWHYVKNINLLINDYKDCAWKAGFLKKIFRTSLVSKIICDLKYNSDNNNE